MKKLKNKQERVCQNLTCGKPIGVKKPYHQLGYCDDACYLGRMLGNQMRSFIGSLMNILPEDKPMVEDVSNDPSRNVSFRITNANDIQQPHVEEPGKFFKKEE